MPATQLKTQAKVVELTTESVQSFCADIGGMFALDISAKPAPPASGTADDLAQLYKKLVAVNSITAEGLLDGVFHIILDHDAAFVTSGTIVMLPEDKIRQNCKAGTVEDAKHVSDAIGETGNLMAGAFDKVFRQGLKGHKHFTQTNVYIGKWDNPESFELPRDKQIVWMPYEITLGDFEPFSFTVAMPAEMIDPHQTAHEEPESDQQPTEPQDESPQKTEEQPDNSVENISIKKAVRTIDQQKAQPKEDTSADIQPADSDKKPAAQPAKPKKEDISAANSQNPARAVNAAARLPDDLRQSLIQTFQLPAEQIMRTDVLWCSPEDTVIDVQAAMRRHNSRYALIGSDSNLEGIISAGDIRAAQSIYLKPVFSHWAGPYDQATLNIKIKWLMAKPVRTIRPEMPAGALFEDLAAGTFSALPVLNQSHKVVGIITRCELLASIINIRKQDKPEN